jgi:hypothetical protein
MFMAPFFLLLTKQVYFQRFVAAFLPNAEFFFAKALINSQSIVATLRPNGRILWQFSGN